MKVKSVPLPGSREGKGSGPEKLLESISCCRPLPGSVASSACRSFGDLEAPSPKLGQSGNPEGLRCYDTIIFGLKPGSRWCFYTDHTCWIPARQASERCLSGGSSPPSLVLSGSPMRARALQHLAIGAAARGLSESKHISSMESSHCLQIIH